jgi:hypothetical protein
MKRRKPAPRRNPSQRTPEAVQEAIQTAGKWFGDPSLVTEPERIPWTPPKAAIEIGNLVALEYASNKWTGEETVYRHEFEQIRSMAISPDGSTIVVWPPFQITERGIEG